MVRWIAGAFGAAGPSSPARALATLSRESPVTIELGPLRIAHTGPPGGEEPTPCLLDGFVDNLDELRAQLALAPTCPPEQVLGAAWRRWSKGMFARLRGEFLLVLWDRARREAVLARDQLGARSLYLHEGSGTISFANEMRPLLALLPTRPEPDRAGVAHWLARSSRPGSATLYAGVSRLDPGTILTIGERGARREAYWRPRYREPLAEPPSQLSERLRGAIEQAVGRRLAREGRTGVLMSGGLDSASVAAVAAGLAPASVAAYSGFFPEHPAVDESALIGELLEALRIPGLAVEVRAGGLLHAAIESARRWEMPLLGWGDFWSLPLLRRAAAEGVTTALSGDGGDEVFGARALLLADALRAGRPREALDLAMRLPGAAYGPGRRAVARMLLDTGLRGAIPHAPDRALVRCEAALGGARWMRPATIAALAQSSRGQEWKRLEGPRWWAHAAHAVTRGIEEAGLFDRLRRRAAAAGVQTRAPLLDLDVVELALRLPPRASLDPRRNRPLLRAAMAGLVPDSVRLRPQKAWFDSLIIDCLTGADAAAIRELLTGPRAELRAYVRVETLVRRLFDDDAPRRADPFGWMWQVWRLLTLECWLRAEQAPPPAAAPPPAPFSALTGPMR